MKELLNNISYFLKRKIMGNLKNISFPYCFDYEKNIVKYAIDDDSNNLSYDYFPSCIKIKGVDLSTFKIIEGPYSKDKNNIYYKYNKIKDVDKSSFKILDNFFYSKDKSNVYYKGKKIPGADVNSFKFVKGEELSIYGKDKNNIYYDGKKLTRIDIKTFRYLGDIWYYQDKDFVYKHGYKLIGISPSGFKDFNGYYFKDSNNVYYKESFSASLQKIKYADSKSFEAINYKYGKDKNYAYYKRRKLKLSNLNKYVPDYKLNKNNY